jgi:hypothetical protein
MHGVIIASTWITLLAALTSAILLGIAGSIQMKPAPLSDADQAKMKQLGMAGFWVLVVALVFALIAAISSSCMHPNLGKFLRTVQDRLATSDLARRLRGGAPGPEAQALGSLLASSGAA